MAVRIGRPPNPPQPQPESERQEYIPKGYQSLITEYIVTHPRCGIWVPMGFGKTVATLTALEILAVLGETGPALILGPNRVVKSTWPREVAKWAHLQNLTCSVIQGTAKQRRLAAYRDADIYACNYETLPWLVRTFGKAGCWRWPVIVADESTRLKSFRGGMRVSKTGTRFYQGAGGLRAKELGRVAHTLGVRRFIELSGTPAPNGLKDLWGQLWFLDAGKRLGASYKSFMSRWFKKDYDGYSVFPHQFADAEIHTRVADICMSLKIEDWYDIKQPIVQNIEVELSPQAMVTYTKMEKEMYAEIDEYGVEAVNAAVRTQKCLQLASGAIWVDRELGEWRTVHVAKLRALESVVQEVNHEPLLVVYQWNHTRDRILREFPFARVLDANPETEDAWNAGEIGMLLAHPRSAGHGLNLQDGGNNIVFYDHWWDLEEYQQIIERVGAVRQLQSGHDRVLYVRHLVATGTVDELVMKRRDSKRSVQEILLEATRAHNSRELL